jgi:dTDP-4-amino-4,6-dideoxygalactose transaminase
LKDSPKQECYLVQEKISPVREKFLVYGAPLIGEAEIAEVLDTLRSGWLGTGPKVKRFEQDLQNYVEAKHAIALNSCTAGLELALDVARVNEGDEVITTPMTFCATSNVIIHRGAKPVFVDVERETMNIDPARIEAAITPRTRAILPVHLTGRPCDMKAIMEIANRRGLAVIEDCAHALETLYEGRKVGTFGQIGAYSFYVTKNVCTGEGGMVVTNRDDWADELRMKSLHGISRDAWKRFSASGYQPYETIYPGYKFNMMDIQGALGIHQLARVEENLKIREKYWKLYDQAFRDVPQVEFPSTDLPVGSRHARHLYVLWLRLDRLRITRDQFVDAMKAENIGTGVHYTALHLHQYYRDTFGYKPGDMPNAEWIGERTISLPLSPSLSLQDAEDVIEAVRRVCRNHAR